MNELLSDVSPLHRVMMRLALGATDSVDAAVHHANADPVPGDVEGRSLTPLVGHRVVAAQGAGLWVVLKGQVSASNLDSPDEGLGQVEDDKFGKRKND